MSVERVGPDAVAWTFSDAVLDPGGMSDLRVNGQGPAELVEWAGARLVVRYDAIADPATWEAAAENDEPSFGDGRHLAPADGALDPYT